MNITNTQKVIFLIVLVLALAAVFFLPKDTKAPVINKPNPNNSVTDFNSCVAAGNPVMESFPRQCSANGKTYTEAQTTESEVVITSPQRGELVTSPLKISGQALGSWFFEANLPVILKDDKGNILAQKGMQATEDWMTTGFVDFEGEITFTMPQSQFGLLIIHNDNPSGDEERDKEYVIPVRFK